MINKKIFLLSSVFIGAIYLLVFNDYLYGVLISFLILFKSKMVSLANIFYSFLSTFLLSSKSKIVLYVKTLTIYKTTVLFIKRFILDNIVSKWLSEVVISPIKGVMLEYIKYYFSLNLKNKIKRILYFVIPLVAFVWVIQAAGLIENILFLAELKAIVIGFFKILWLISGKIISTAFLFFQNSWLAPIVEIFALSFLLSKIEKLPYIGKYLSAFFKNVSQIIEFIFVYFNKFYNKFVYENLSKNIKEKVTLFSNKLENFLENTKHDNEIYVIRRFKKDFLETGELKRIISKFDMAEVNSIISKELNIKAYIELDNGYVFLLESFASCGLNGNSHTKIKNSHFWILNYSKHEIEILSRNNYFLSKYIKPKKLILLKSLKENINDIVIVSNTIESKFKKL